MRTLPIFVVIDVSESMIGETMTQLEQGLATLSDTLKTIPEALETARICVIAFAGAPRIVVPMVEVAHLYPPRLPVGGGTALGAALDLLMDRIDLDVTRANAHRKGDWRPIVFLLTDGVSTDDPRPAIQLWKKSYARAAHLVAISVGGRADLGVLREIADKVMFLNDMQESAFASLVSWMTQSIVVQSQSLGIGAGGSGLSLEKDLPPEMSEDDGTRIAHPDDRFAVILGRCERSEKPYLLKYEKGLRGETRYDFVTAVGVTEDYYKMSGEGEGKLPQISAHLLHGGGSCPHCPNHITMAQCGKCQGIHCLDLKTKQAICPWCGASGQYGPSAEGADFNVNRGLG